MTRVASNLINIMSKDCDDYNDLMDISDSEEFCQQFLSQFHSIEWQTIESLVDNGYRNREELMAFDLKEDLPLLPNVSMAQKSLLRKALQLLLSDEDLERKVNDIKADNVTIDVTKRKRKANETPSVTKRSRNADSIVSDNDYMTQSGSSHNGFITVLSPQKQYANRIKLPQTVLVANTYAKEVPNSFQFINTRANKTNIINRNTISDEEEEEDYDEIVEQELDVKRSSLRLSNGGIQSRFGFNNSTIKIEPIDNNDRRRSNRSSVVSPTTTTTTTTPKAKLNKPTNTVPTPTEIELREHLAKQKAMGKTRRSRK